MIMHTKPASGRPKSTRTCTAGHRCTADAPCPDSSARADWLTRLQSLGSIFCAKPLEFSLRSADEGQSPARDRSRTTPIGRRGDCVRERSATYASKKNAYRRHPCPPLRIFRRLNRMRNLGGSCQASVAVQNMLGIECATGEGAGMS